MKHSDSHIVSELQKGNTQVFRELYNYFPMILKMVLKNSGTEEEAKDLFQNGLIILYENIQKPDFQLTAKLSSYLYAICDNNWKKIITRDKSRGHADIDNLPQDSSTVDIELDNEQPKKSLAQYIQDLLENLGDPCKSIIVWHEFHQLNMKEITQKLGYANEHTTRQQKYKCIQKLKKLIPENIGRNYLNSIS